MNSKQFGILLVLVVVLGGAMLLVRHKEHASWENANPAIGKKLLGTFPINDVSHLVFKQGTNEVNLAKKDAVWSVRERNDYPANFSEISDLLVKLGDLKIVQSEKVGPSQMPRLALVAGQGTNAALELNLKDQNDKTMKSLLLGKKHMRKSDRPSPYGDMGDSGWPDGRYVKVGDSDNVDLISDALANVEPKPEQWLNKDFFKIEKVRSIAIAFPEPTNSWKLTRETEAAEWKLAEPKPGEQLDSTKTSSLASPLSSPSFVDVLGTKAGASAPEKPTVATVETFDNFTYTLTLGQKTNDNFPLMMSVVAQPARERTPGKDEKPEDKDKLDKEFKEKVKKLDEKVMGEKAFEKWIYLVSTFTVDPLLKERHQLLAEKKEEPKKDNQSSTNQPAAIQIPKPETNAPPGGS
jgi:hypothetical protein